MDARYMRAKAACGETGENLTVIRADLMMA
jgi:hypothetical protein